jgi:hypothetical protein
MVAETIAQLAEAPPQPITGPLPGSGPTVGIKNASMQPMQTDMRSNTP